MELVYSEQTQMQPLYVAPKKQITNVLFYRYTKYLDVKKTTLKGYSNALKRFNDYLVMIDCKEPTRATIQAYKEYLSTSELSNGTQHQYLRAVKGFFEWTEAEGFYSNVAKGIKLPKVRHDQHKKDAFEIEDIKRLEASLKRDTEEQKRLYAMFLLSVTLGLRTIELHRANVEDIKVLKGYPFLYIQGKGRDEKDHRKALNKYVYEALEDYLNNRTAPLKGDTPLFTSTSNRSKGKRIATTTISTMLKEMLIKGGYDSDRLTAHSLRHTTGTTAYNVSKNIYETQNFMRHEDPKTTEIYIHDTNSIKSEIELSEKIANAYFNEGEQTTSEKLKALIDRLDPQQQEQALEMLEREFKQ